MPGKRKLSEREDLSGSFLRVWNIWQERKRELNIIRTNVLKRCTNQNGYAIIKTAIVQNAGDINIWYLPMH